MDLPLSVLSQVAATLDDEGIPYVLVGSFASSLHGLYRATADIDILADLKSEQVHGLFEALKSRFYLDEHVMREAVSQKRSFNAIHFDSVFKVDIFVSGSDEFARTQLERRQLRRLSLDSDEQVYVATAEDTILAKLKWYRSGQETSNNQWNDVVGVLGTAGNTLDFDYLRVWAERLGVPDLLQETLDAVRDDSGI